MSTRTFRFAALGAGEAALVPVRLRFDRTGRSIRFWPGGGPVPEPVFYSYTYPEPDGFRDRPVAPAEAYYSTDLFEYLLPYEAVRNADDPDAMLRSFFQTTYEAGAEPGGWDREALERPDGRPPSRLPL